MIMEQSPVRMRALKILGSRQMSASEMERRLVSKGETQEDARDTAEWLVDIGAIDDEEYAVSIVRHYTAKGYGLARVRDELFRRGIPRDLWDEALSGIEGMEDAVADYLEKKLKGSHDKDDIRRASDTLCRRGFSYEEARTAIARYVQGLGNRE